MPEELKDLVEEEEEEEDESTEDEEEDTEDEDQDDEDDSDDSEDDEDDDSEDDSDDDDDADPTEKFLSENPEISEEIQAASSYRELFPTLDAAKEAKAAAEGLQATREFFADANPEEHFSVLEDVGGKDDGKKLVKNFAARFLPALAKADNATYSQLVHAMTQTQLMAAYAAGDEDDDEDELRAAAETVAKFLYKDKKFASGQRKIELPKVEDVKKGSREPDSATQKAYADNLKRASGSVYGEGRKQAVKLINKQLKAAGHKPGFTTDALVDKIISAANTAMGKNPVILNSVKGAFAKLPNDNFASEHQENAVKTYMTGLKKVLPKQFRAAGIKGKAKKSPGLQKPGTKSKKSGGGKSSISIDWTKPGVYKDILGGAA